MAALFYVTMLPGLSSQAFRFLWPLVAFAVTISTIVFALSAYPGTKWWYGEGKCAD